ncbi:MAG: YihA family ribosome biogenesis GTP-binding protein [Candidatus Hydrogenedentes bacterium]|nr:YihA family ribosome biogenesis GTP-binding protein [Candidatus Hydrogenedentota bacterium]
MRVVQASFVKSALRPEHYPRDGRPELAFVGRSNVGKSTMLNVLLNRKGLAKTSKTPGKTQTVNFFDVNGTVYFVDLPGYGYARVSKTLQEQWARILTSYLVGRAPLRLVVHLVDARHKPGANDQELLDVIERAEKPTIIVATKVDKLSAAERAHVADELRENLGLCDDALIIPFSSVTKVGLRELWNVIDEQLR